MNIQRTVEIITEKSKIFFKFGGTLIFFTLLIAGSLAIINQSNSARMVLVVGFGITLVALLIVLIFGYRRVPEGSISLIERLGTFNRVAYPGPNWLIPLLEDLARVNIGKYKKDKGVRFINLREQIHDVKVQRVFTDDNVELEINTLLTWKVIDPKKIAYKIDNVIYEMEAIVKSSVRDIIADIAFDDVFSESREEVRQKLTTDPTYKVKNETIEKLKKEGLPESMLKELKLLIENDDETREKFIQTLAKIIGKHNLERTIGGNVEDSVQTLILKYTKEPSFTLTKLSYKRLKKDIQNEEVFAELERLKYREFTTKKKFLNTLEETIGPKWTNQYESYLLEHAKKGFYMKNNEDEWGIELIRVEIEDIIPMKDKREALLKRAVAETNLKTAKLEADAKIAEAEGLKQSKILDAEGEAEKIQKIYEAIRNAKPDEKLIALQYLEALKSIANGQASKIFMPFQAADLLSSFGSIKELDQKMVKNIEDSIKDKTQIPPEKNTES